MMYFAQFKLATCVSDSTPFKETHDNRKTISGDDENFPVGRAKVKVTATESRGNGRTLDPSVEKDRATRKIVGRRVKLNNPHLGPNVEVAALFICKHTPYLIRRVRHGHRSFYFTLLVYGHNLARIGVNSGWRKMQKV